MMWKGLLRSWQNRRIERALQRRAIPDALWKRTLVRYPFLVRRDAAAGAELRRLTSLFLDLKEFDAVAPLRLTDAMAVAIAAQAALPVLRLGLHWYDGFVGVVVHEDQVVARRERIDPDGVVHEFDEPLAGEAMPGGPVMLSWRDVRAAGRDAGPAYNVVIHEFAHVLDMSDGVANGQPRLPPDLDPSTWQQSMARSFDAFVEQVDGGASTVLDPYGATAPEEFFAVAAEAFFVSPLAIRAEHPDLYGMFVRFFRQDPALETVPPRRRD